MTRKKLNMTSKKLTKNDLAEINGASASAEQSEKDFEEYIDKEILPKQKQKGRKKKENYVNPDVFKKQIIQYYKDGIMTNELGKSISDIAHRLGFAPNFINYTYKEEMVGDAIVKMFHALKNKKFKPSKGNAFSYYTKIAFNAFCNRIKKEKRIHEAVNNYQTELFDVLVHSGNMPDAHHEIEESDVEIEHEY